MTPAETSSKSPHVRNSSFVRQTIAIQAPSARMVCVSAPAVCAGIERGTSRSARGRARRAGAGRTGGGLRRPGDQPALHHADRFQPERPSSGAGRQGQHLRGHFADLLVRHDHRHDHVRASGHARGQRRRGRHHGPDHVDKAWAASPPSAHDTDPRRPGRVRRLAVLRRQHDHPGDLGAVRDRRGEGRCPVAG